MNKPISTKAQASQVIAEIGNSWENEQSFSFVRRISAVPGRTQAEIPVAEGTHFQVFGYNIEYQAQSDGKEVLWMQLSQAQGNRLWSSDYEPLKSIATPGVRLAAAPPARYGYRHFPAFVRANDKIKIEILNETALDETLEVIITVVGRLLYIPR